MEQNTDAVIDGIVNFIGRNSRKIVLGILSLLGIEIIINTIYNYENYKTNFDITGLANPFFIISSILLIGLLVVTGITIIKRKHTSVLKIVTIISGIYLVFSCIFYFGIYSYENDKAKEMMIDINQKIEENLESSLKKTNKKKQTYEIYQNTPLEERAKQINSRGNLPPLDYDYILDENYYISFLEIIMFFIILTIYSFRHINDSDSISKSEILINRGEF